MSNVRDCTAGPTDPDSQHRNIAETMKQLAKIAGPYYSNVDDVQEYVSSIRGSGEPPIGKTSVELIVALRIGSQADVHAIAIGFAKLRDTVMPCGVKPYDVVMERVERVGSFPLVDIPCPCGDTTHWLVKFEEKGEIT